VYIISIGQGPVSIARKRGEEGREGEKGEKDEKGAAESDRVKREAVVSKALH
jgi:hypothetical protein